MKDDISTPTAEGGSPNEFEWSTPGPRDRSRQKRRSKTRAKGGIESGLDTPPAVLHEGLGHEVLLKSLSDDLGAETNLEFSADGMRITMNMPIRPDARAEPAE